MNEQRSLPETDAFHLDTYHEYQVRKRARTDDIATWLLACFTIGGSLALLAFLAWVLFLVFP